MSSFADKIQNLQTKKDTIEANKLQENLKNGELPQGYTVTKSLPQKNADITAPKNGYTIRDENGQSIATYQKSIDKWVLSRGISPDTIPSIGFKETISQTQYNYMCLHAQYYAYVNPGYLYQDAKLNYSINPENDKNFDEFQNISGLRSIVQTKHRRIPKEIKDILKQCEYSGINRDINNHAKYKGINSSVTTEDIMTIMYKTMSRIPELENEPKSPQQQSKNIDTLSPDISDYR